MSDLLFTELNIQKLFGHEAAEDENPQRLREYYFKSPIYDQIITEQPLRILVGHKGIGKSALFSIGVAEAIDQKDIAIIIQPNDITELNIDTSEFLQAIRSWSNGISKILVKKVFDFLGVSNNLYITAFSHYEGNLLSFFRSAFRAFNIDDYSKDKESFIKKFLDNPKLFVYIDDLDRGWEGTKGNVKAISTLLNAVRDLSRTNIGLYFKISLRSDVYYLVRTSDESTDKIEGSVIWYAWTNHEIFVLLVKRIETFFGREVDIAHLLKQRQSNLAAYLDPIMEPRFSGRGHWENAPIYRVLMSLIRRRPRDLVKLCTLAARQAHLRRSSLIQTEDFKAIFDEYSQGRIQDAINEYRSELPNIQHLLLNMKSNHKERINKKGFAYTTAELIQKINKICESHRFSFATGMAVDAKSLAAFMYKINFLIARKEQPNKIIRKYFEENRYLISGFADFGFDWEIHPAYRWALQPDNIDAIYETLQLTSEDD